MTPTERKALRWLLECELDRQLARYLGKSREPLKQAILDEGYDIMTELRLEEDRHDDHERR